MTAPHADDDTFTELVDADFPRVDLVGKAANGTRFLIAKAAQQGDLTNPSLLAADAVRDLIEKAADVTDPAPAPVEKAELDVTDAPAVDDLIPEAPGGTTAVSAPGSADWEQLDGDTAMNAVAVLGRLKAVLGWLADREGQEAATSVDPDAAENAWDLDGMGACLDAMIAQLAGFAVGEHMEAEAADGIAKAAAVAGPLAVVEGLSPIAKAGRTLSGANESKLNSAKDLIVEVLNSLPQAPAADDVTKETAVPETTAETAEPVDVLAKALAALPPLTAADVAGALLAGGRTQEVAKAAGDPQLAVFDANGTLIGTIDPAKLSPIATSPAAAEPKADEAPAEDAPAEDDTAAADPVADQADAAAPDAATIPGTATVQSPPAEDDTVTKTVDARLEEALAPVTKQLSELAAENEVLKEQVRKMGGQPDNRRSPVLNGGTGTPGSAHRDGQPVDERTDVLKAIAAETDPEKKLALQKAAFFKAYGDISANAAGVLARFGR